MRTPQRIALPLIAGVFAIFVATDLASAKMFKFQDPEARMDEWRQGLLRFVEKHPDLTDDQLHAIQNLADINDTRSFATTLDAERRELLVQGLQELSSVLPHLDYLKLLRSFGDLRFWLVANELATQFQVALPNCNCTTNSNCQTNSCKNVACEPSGTTHTGVCAPASTLPGTEI